MSAPYSIAERKELLRSRAQGYRVLADALKDRRTASEVSGYAQQLEAEIVRLEEWERVQGAPDCGRSAVTP
jgi:hypothetical protein